MGHTIAAREARLKAQQTRRAQQAYRYLADYGFLDEEEDGKVVSILRNWLAREYHLGVEAEKQRRRRQAVRGRA